jgi:HK97 family phage major capsid protein
MDKEMNEIVETVTNEVRTFNEDTINPIKERLASLEERGTSPSDEKVTDLEKRLDDAEARSQEKMEALQEEVRLAQAAPFVASESEKSDPFEGAFFRNINQTGPALLSGETRNIDSASSIASAGKMNADQASSFLDYVVGDNATLSVIERRMMSGPTADLDRIAVGSRKLLAGAENTAVSDTNGISFGKRSLQTTEAVWAENISLSFLEDNIAGGNAEGQIAAVVGKASGEELTDRAWNGDGTTTGWLAINTGFEDLLDANSDSDVTEVDVSAKTTAEACLNLVYKSMPSQYRNLSGQTIFCTPAFATVYMDEIADRKTGLGDATLTGGMSGLRYYGIPILVDRHIGGTQVYMTPRDNLVFGVQRDVTSESEWNPRARQIELTVSFRFDFQYKFGGVAVRGHTVHANLR